MLFKRYSLCVLLKSVKHALEEQLRGASPQVGYFSNTVITFIIDIWMQVAVC